MTNQIIPMLNIVTQQDLLSFVRSELTEAKHLSIRGVARLCGVSDTAIIQGANFHSQKLAQSLISQGFDAANISQNGFPAKAVWLTIEYFAYDSKAKASIAKQIARTFGMLGVIQVFDELLKPKQPQLPQDYEEALEHLLGQVRINKELQSANTELTEHNQIMAQSIDLNAPKVAFANKIEFSHGSISIGDYAKMLGTGRTRLFSKLRELKIIQKKPSNIPYQCFIDRGYFEVGETPIIHSDGEVEFKPYAKITGKGQTWLYRKLRHNQHSIARDVAQMTLI